MDFHFTPIQKEIHKAAKALCKEKITPVAEKVERREIQAHELLTELANAKLLGITIPEEYGGRGADLISQALLIEEIAVSSAAAALSAHMSALLSTLPFLKFGSEAQRQKYLPKIVSSECISAFALTEPGCGSDATALETTAVRENSSYIINGKKAYIGNAPVADLIIVFARTGGAGAKGISAFAVDKGTPGLSAGEQTPLMCLHGLAMSELEFKNCEVPADGLIGNEGDGFKIAMQALEPGRISLAAIAVGIARAAMEESVARAESRFAFDKLIGAFQEVNHKIATMRMNYEVARQLIHYAAWLHDKGSSCAADIAIAKLFASEIAVKSANDALQIHGAAGMTEGAKVERLYRDAKMCEIAEGTSEVMRMVIARDTLRD